MHFMVFIKGSEQIDYPKFLQGLYRDHESEIFYELLLQPKVLEPLQLL